MRERTPGSRPRGQSARIGAVFDPRKTGIRLHPLRRPGPGGAGAGLRGRGSMPCPGDPQLPPGPRPTTFVFNLIAPGGGRPWPRPCRHPGRTQGSRDLLSLRAVKDLQDQREFVGIGRGGGRGRPWPAARLFFDPSPFAALQRQNSHASRSKHCRCGRSAPGGRVPRQKSPLGRWARAVPRPPVREDGGDRTLPEFLGCGISEAAHGKVFLRRFFLSHVGRGAAIARVCRVDFSRGALPP